MSVDQKLNEKIDSNREQNQELCINFATLPIELLVHIISFLNICDVVKLRYVSTRLRSACETSPTLWRVFMWPQICNHEENCVSNVLKLCGRHIRKLSFPNHMIHIFRLTAMLHHCSNLVELGIPTSKMTPDQLKRLIEPMVKLKSLDIAWNCELHPLLVICAKLKELTVRISLKHQLNYYFDHTLNSWLDNWVTKGLLPGMLNIIVGINIPFTNLVNQWLRLNPQSPAGHTGFLKLFSTYKVSMDFYPALPFIELPFGQSCVLPFVESSKCGLDGFEGLEKNILLTDSTYHGRVVCKAKMIQLNPGIAPSQFCLGITSLSSVTCFDASRCLSLYSSHLEQLAMACTNLQQLNLADCSYCLRDLQGLRIIGACCKNLLGLNLMGILSVESYAELWKILVAMKLTYLGIELSVIVPLEHDGNVESEIFASFQECFNLKSIEIFSNEYLTSDCTAGWRNLSVLSNFPSLVHCFVSYIPVDVDVIIRSCSQLKYLMYSGSCSDFSPSLIQHYSLEQVYITLFNQRSSIPDTFLQSISGHGGLVHVVLLARYLSIEGITALINNSPDLLTCHIYTKSLTTGATLNASNLSGSLRKKFRSRKLFTHGSFQLTKDNSAIGNNLVERHMDVMSLWLS